MNSLKNRRITVLGSTGSVGRQALAVAQNMGYQICALSAATDICQLEQQIRQFHPQYAAVADEKLARELRVRVQDTDCTVLSGVHGVEAAAEVGEADIVLNAIVGIAGLRPSIQSHTSWP